MSQDTYPYSFSNPVELNRYVYTGNDPINRIDPSGQSLVELAVNLAEDTVVQGALLGAGLGAASALLCGGNALEGALTGAVLGGAFAGGMIIAPAFTPVVGIGGGALGLSAAYHDYQENGMTACNFINGVGSLMAIHGSFASGFGGGGPSMQFALAGNTGGSSTGLAIQGVTVNPQALTGLGVISLVNMISEEGREGNNVGWGTEDEFWAGRNAYEAEVREIPAQAYAKMAAGEFGSEHEAAVWANLARRLLGIKYKNMTAPKILEEIYRRNLEFYGDPLGPTMEYYENRRYTDAQIIASSGKPGGRDFIQWVVKNTGWDIKNWASWSP